MNASKSHAVAKSMMIQNMAFTKLEGDVTITDKFGIIRGTFVQTPDGHGSFNDEFGLFLKEEMENEWRSNVVGGPQEEDWQMIEKQEEYDDNPFKL